MSHEQECLHVCTLHSIFIVHPLLIIALTSRFRAEERAKRPHLCHIPFGFGPRSCIGMRFALLIVKAALIEVLKKYSFVKAPDTEV